MRVFKDPNDDGMSMDALAQQAVRVYGPLDSNHWFHASNASLDGRTPFQAIIDGDRESVKKILDDLEGAKAHD